MDIIHIKEDTLYVIEVLEKFNMNNEKPLRNTKPITDDKLRNIKFNQTTYRSAIGKLLYIAICTRPDILFSVSKAARKSNNPNMEDWNNVVRILRYLKGTTIQGNQEYKPLLMPTLQETLKPEDQSQVFQ